MKFKEFQEGFKNLSHRKKNDEVGRFMYDLGFTYSKDDVSVFERDGIRVNVDIPDNSWKYESGKKNETGRGFSKLYNLIVQTHPEFKNSKP